MNDIVELTPDPIDTAALVARLHDPRAGAIDVFLGCTRAETSDGRELIALDYEAYPDMAMKQMRDLLSEARQRWPIERAVVIHRIGRVGLGEPSVLIGVATPHRGESFEACRFLIDELKKSVPVWKKEVWSDATTSWVAGTPSNEC